MRLKSYFAPTVEAALRMARAELGENAMLVQSRKANAEGQHLGAYEVVFALEEARTPRAAATRSAEAGGERAAVDGLTRQVAQLRKQVDRLADALTGAAAGPAAPGRGVLEPAAHGIYRELVRADIAPDLARRLAESAAFSVEADGGNRRNLARSLQTLVKIAPRLGADRHAENRGRVAALVGPAGAGKTSMLVKLAVRYGLEARRSCQLLSMDASRIGAAEQLRCYAAILGLGCETYETVHALEQGIEEYRRKNLILIDTPGYPGKELGPGEELAEYLASQPEIDVHLVLPATARAADLSMMLERFSAFEPDKLILTRLDESTTSGAALTVAAQADLPISFLADGPSIPDDLAEASVTRLADALPCFHPESGPGAESGRWGGGPRSMTSAGAGLPEFSLATA